MREMHFSVHDWAGGGAREGCVDWDKGAEARAPPQWGHEPRSMPVSLWKSSRQSGVAGSGGATTSPLIEIDPARLIESDPGLDHGS